MARGWHYNKLSLFSAFFLYIFFSGVCFVFLFLSFSRFCRFCRFCFCFVFMLSLELCTTTTVDEMLL